ncbi:MAG: hypothetical protein ACKODH_17950 [Limisphaerales bacterium]
MPTEPAKVDWERAKLCLAALQQESPAFLRRALLIGGAACWFYRHSLSRANDPDFHVPLLAPELEARWLSKDLDFTGIFSGDAFALLPQLTVRDAQRREFLQVEGVRIGFAQVGLTLDPEEAMQHCRVVRFNGTQGQPVECFIADPVTLYREKLALVERRNAPADPLHLAVLAEYVRMEVCQRAEELCAAATLTATKAVLNFLKFVASRAPELPKDERVVCRVRASLQNHAGSASPADVKFLRELVGDGSK